MLLEGKNAVIYGGAGSIGRAMARAFAREGATVHLAGRSQQPLADAAAEIRETGGDVETAQLDACDQSAVDDHADSVATTSGSLNVSVNVISLDETFGTLLVDAPLDEFALRRQLAAEFGRHGIRVQTVQSNGVPETIRDADARQAMDESVVSGTLLSRAASLDDVGNVAVFAASDHARAMTATKLNITCGGEVD